MNPTGASLSEHATAMRNRKNILFVEDDVAIRDVVRLMLEHEGYSVSLLQSGDALLTDDFPLPDLVILDKQLPGVDGLDICRFLKKGERTCHLPVLMLSASPQIAQMAQDACADGCLEKPFRMQEIRDEVARLTAPGYRSCDTTVLDS